MKDAGLEVDVDETGTTFEENAILKAKAVADKAKEEVTIPMPWLWLMTPALRLTILAGNRASTQPDLWVPIHHIP